MGFWVYGNDCDTGSRTSLYSDASDEDGARRQAQQQGMIVERIEMAMEEFKPDVEWEAELQTGRNVYAVPEPLVPQRTPTESQVSAVTFAGMALSIAETLSVIASGGSLFYLAFQLAWIGRAPGQAIVYAFAGLLSFFYNAALAIVFSYVRQQLRIQRPEAPVDSQGT